jgi:hypothetical protein
MRTHRQLFALPLFLLAIWMQALLPVVLVEAAVAAAHAEHVITCSSSFDDENDTGGAPADHQHRFCPGCHFASASHAILLTATPVVPQLGLLPDPVVIDPAPSAGPRGPPRFRPPPRAPPAFA